MHFRFLRFASIALLATLLAVPAVWAEEPEAASVDANAPHEVVTIHRSRLRPARITVDRDVGVSWLNYSGSAAQVILPEETAEYMTCARARPTFSRVAKGRLASRPMANHQLLLPCQLPPGTYDYEVLLMSGSGGVLQGMAPFLNYPPLRIFHGELVVR